MDKEQQWMLKYNLAKQYYNQNNNLLIPKRFVIDGINLGDWIQKQRKQYKEGKLSQNRINLLNKINMQWKVNPTIEEQDREWNEMYSIAQNFFNEHKHLLISRRTVINEASIGFWIFEQRKRYKRKTLSKEKIALLNEINMVWELENKNQTKQLQSQELWNKKYNIAKQYYIENGDLLVPDNYIFKNINLGNWISRQRNAYKQNNLNITQIMLLNMISMEWELIGDINKVSDTWLKYYNLAQNFYIENNHLSIPLNYDIENLHLGYWLANQKKYYRENRLIKEKIQLLENINIIWQNNECNEGKYFYDNKNNKIIKKDWNYMYSIATDFYNEFYDLYMPNNFIYKNENLGKWLSRQRTKYKNKELSQQQIKLLENIEMFWETKRITSSSLPEQIIYFYIKKYFPNAINLYKEKGYELDIFIPEINLAIEFDGIMHKNREKKDIEKTQKCKKDNIFLIRIRDYKCKFLNFNISNLKQFKLYDNYENNDYNNYNNLIKEILNFIFNKYGIKKIPDVNVSLDIEKIMKSYKVATNIKWKKAFLQLKQFYNKNKHYNIPNDYYCDFDLKKWIISQRKLYKKNKLTMNQIKCLNSINFIWNVSDNLWQDNYNLLIKYKKEYGNINLLIENFIYNDKDLGTWLTYQRKRYKSKNLSSDRIKLLNKLDIIWDISEATWERNYLNIKNGIKENKRWIVHQINLYNKNKLEKEKIKKLKEIGIIK